MAINKKYMGSVLVYNRDTDNYTPMDIDSVIELIASTIKIRLRMSVTMEGKKDAIRQIVNDCVEELKR